MNTENPTPHRQAVESSCLTSIGYEAGARILEVEFRKGTVYRYLDVPASIHDSLMKASSIGRFFVTSIRDRFQYVRSPMGADLREASAP